MKRLIPLAVVVLLIIFFIPPSFAKEKILLMGDYQPLSGGAAPWGIGMRRGLLIAIDEINKAGGIVIGNIRYKLDEVCYDHKYTAEGGLAAVNKLVYKDNVKYIPATCGSAANRAASSITTPNKVIQASVCSDFEFLGMDKPYNFRILSDPPTYEPRVYRWMKKQYPEVKKIALLNRDGPWGRGVSKNGRLAAESLGYSVVYDEIFKPGTKDYSILLTKLIASKPDLIDSAGATFGEHAMIIKQARELGYKGLISIITTIPRQLFKISGKQNCDGVITFFTYDWKRDDPKITERQRRFAAAWEDKYHEPIVGLGVQAYDSMFMIKAAMEKAGTIDTTKVVKVLPKLEYTGLLQGDLKFGGEITYGIPHQIILPQGMLVCKDGKFEFKGWAK